MRTFFAFVAVISIGTICTMYDRIGGVPSVLVFVLSLIAIILIHRIVGKRKPKSANAGKTPSSINHSKIRQPREQNYPLDIPTKDRARAEEFLKRQSAMREYETDERQDMLAASRNSDACKVLVFDAIYIIEGTRRCFHCGRKTPVIAFGLERYLTFGETVDSYYHDTINVVKDIWPLPPKLERYLSKHYEYYERFDKDHGNTNHCVHCGRKQGNYYLFDEMYAPSCGEGIFFDLEMSGDALTYYPIKLPHEVLLYCDFNGWGGGSPFIPDESQIVTGRFSWE